MEELEPGAVAEVAPEAVADTWDEVEESEPGNQEISAEV